MIVTSCQVCHEVIRLDAAKLAIWIDDKGGSRCGTELPSRYHLPPGRYVILAMAVDEIDRADAEHKGSATPFEYMRGIARRFTHELDEFAAQELGFGKHHETTTDGES
jgi:hypothetical protein